MKERLKGMIGEMTARELVNTKAQLELTQKLADVATKHNKHLDGTRVSQAETIDYLLDILIDSGVELPERVQDLIADRVEQKFFGKALDDTVESKHSMFSGVGGILGGLGNLERAVEASVFESELRAKTRAGW